MKLCEVSYLFSRFKQAMAVLQDVAEPADPVERKAHFVGPSKGANKEVQKTLKAFQKAIEGEDFEMAVRIYALPLTALKEVGIYSVAKSAIERMAPEGEKDSPLAMLDGFAPKEPDPSLRPDDFQRYFLMAAAVAAAAVLLGLLYWLEQWSLGRLKK
eukprot:UN2892